MIFGLFFFVGCYIVYGLIRVSYLFLILMSEGVSLVFNFICCELLVLLFLFVWKVWIVLEWDFVYFLKLLWEVVICVSWFGVLDKWKDVRKLSLVISCWYFYGSLNIYGVFMELCCWSFVSVKCWVLCNSLLWDMVLFWVLN